MRHDDMGWSTQSSCMVADINIGLGPDGRIVTYEATHSGPPMQDDRPIGALLAGLPVISPPTPANPSPIHTARIAIADRWIYDAVPHVAETGRGTYQIGERDRRSRSACATIRCAPRSSSSRISPARWR
jgi:hypothetical protein